MSQFIFHNIAIKNDGTVEYLWQCQQCGSISMNIGQDKLPASCKSCDELLDNIEEDEYEHGS